MIDYGWFKLLVRGIGILLLGMSIPMLLYYLSLLTLEGSRATGGTGPLTPMLIGLIPSFLAYGVQAAFGAYLLFGATRLIGACIRGVSGRCVSCGYDISTATTPNCPECGTEIRRPNPPAP